MSAVEVMRPEPDLEQEALSWPERARGFVVFDQKTYDVAARKLLALAEMRREIIQHHAEPKQKAFEAHKSICAAEKRLLDPVAEAERIIKGSIGTYDMEQRRIRETADRKAREESERLAMEQREREIVEAEAAGAAVEEVTAMIEAPMIVPRVAPMAPAIQHRPAAGVSTARTYRARVTDIKALCRAVADGAVAHTLVLPNETALNALARAQKGVLSIPGVLVEEDFNVRAGRTR